MLCVVCRSSLPGDPANSVNKEKMDSEVCDTRYCIVECRYKSVFMCGRY